MIPPIPEKAFSPFVFAIKKSKFIFCSHFIIHHSISENKSLVILFISARLYLQKKMLSYKGWVIESVEVTMIRMRRMDMAFHMTKEFT